MNYTTVSASGNSFKGLKTLIEMLAPNGTSLPVDPPYVERGSLFVLKGADPSQDKIYLSDGAGGWTLASGSPGDGGTIDSIIPGANISVDATDPANPIISATINQNGKYLIGGGAQWSGTGYNYDVSANYYFNGSFNVGPVNLTLSAPDATNDRFDAFVADDAGNITTIEGTAAATPVTPAIPDNQLLIQYVFVQHGTTAPALTQENIYLENTEWTGSNYTTSGTQVGTTNFDATDLPKQGTKCIDNLLDGRTGIRFNKGATIDVSSYSQLSLWVRLGATATAKQKLNVQFENSSLAPTGNAIDLFQYGIQRGILGTWQLAVVDLSLFGVTSVQGFRMILTGGTNGTQYGWDVDLMILTNGSAPVTVSPTISFFKDEAKIADESAIDIIAGAGMTITAVDDPVNKRVKYTFSAASSGGGGYSTTASGTNTYTATVSGLSSYTGLIIDVTFTNANTGAATLNINSLGAIAITKNGGGALVAGDIAANSAFRLWYNGTSFEVVGKVGGAGGGATLFYANKSFFPSVGDADKVYYNKSTGLSYLYDTTNNVYVDADLRLNYAIASGTNTYTATIPGLSTLSAGNTLKIKFTNANTGASTLNPNSLGAISILKNGSSPVGVGDIPAGSIITLVYDGTNFQIQGIYWVPPVVASGEKALSVTSAGVQTTYDITAPPTVNILSLQGATWTNDECTGISGYVGQMASDSGYIYTCTDGATGKWTRFPRVMPSVTSGEKALTVTSAGVQKTYDVADVTDVDVADLQTATWTGNKCTGVAGFEGQMAADDDYIYYCYDELGANWLRIENNKVSLEKRLGTIDDSAGTATNSALDTAFPAAVIGNEVKGAVAAGKFKLYTKEAAGTWTFIEITNC